MLLQLPDLQQECGSFDAELAEKASLMEAVKSQGADLLRGRDVEDTEGGIDLQNEMLQLEEKWAKVIIIRTGNYYPMKVD